MSTDDSEAAIAHLETARSDLAAILRGASLNAAARTLEELPPAGVEGWGSAWIASLGLAKGAAERWRVTLRGAEQRALECREREEFARMGRRLAAVVQGTLTLIRTITGTLEC